MAKQVYEIIQEVIPYYKDKGGPESMHTLTYETYAETLEPVYFFILDMMNDLRLKPKKLIDNFTSSPGSSQFGEIGQRKSVMQQQGVSHMERINTIMRSVLNIVYDLKELKIRIQSYDDLKNENKGEAARLSLKQIWMDKVDVTKGNSSIKAMAFGQMGSQTLIDAFLLAKDVKDVNNIDIADRVKRILYPRIEEFNIWLKESEIELRKRYNMERAYLKSQVASLKLYSRWARPYFTNAEELELTDTEKNPSLVNAFNRTILQLTLLGKSGIEFSDMVEGVEFVNYIKGLKEKGKLKKTFNSCVLVDFVFRTVPNQGVYTGRVDVNFRSYALTDEEIKKLEQEMDKLDSSDVYKLIEQATGESIKELQEEIDSFLAETEKSDEKKDEKKDESNPFLALIGAYDKKEKPKEEKKEGEVVLTEDNKLEKEIARPFAAEKAKETAFTIFDVYKKAHGMASYS